VPASTLQPALTVGRKKKARKSPTADVKKMAVAWCADITETGRGLDNNGKKCSGSG